ncbi:MAG: glycoside hydrolase family 5 protein [Candidatus Acidiferrales bacterium]
MLFRACITLLGLACLALGAPRAMSAQQRVLPPLHTSGGRFVDAAGRDVRLTSVNWYGFDQKEYVVGGLDHAPLSEIIAQIRAIGVNSVRLPWANETLERDPVVADYAVKANPEFRGKHAMEIMDAVIAALGRAHIMVILDNHMSRADWCCKESDGNGLWYNADYPEAKWLADWQTIVRRYKHQRWVVGADLRNELRSGAQWGGSDASHDWHAAAERGGNAVLAVNPNLLIMVEGPKYSTDFTGFAERPVVLNVANRLVYSPHFYASGQGGLQSYDDFSRASDARIGFLLHAKDGAPVWIGEFGSCQTLDCGYNSKWMGWLLEYLQENDLSWSYWPLNGTQSSGEGRKYDTAENYGLLSTDYRHIAAPKIVELLRTIEAPSNQK